MLTPVEWVTNTCHPEAHVTPHIVEMDDLEADFIYASRGDHIALFLRASLHENFKARIIAAITAGRIPSVAA
jgi:hypothetical protein